jgi:hypothetical protein
MVRRAGLAPRAGGLPPVFPPPLNRNGLASVYGPDAVKPQFRPLSAGARHEHHEPP